MMPKLIDYTDVYLEDVVMVVALSLMKVLL